MHTSPDTEAVLERYVAAIEAGDEETIRDCFAEDATWHLDGDLPISGTWRGRETILGEFLAAAWSQYEPSLIDIEVTGIVAEGDRAVDPSSTSRARTAARVERRERLPAALFRRCRERPDLRERSTSTWTRSTRTAPRSGTAARAA